MRDESIDFYLFLMQYIHLLVFQKALFLYS